MANQIYVNEPYDSLPFPLEMANNLYKFPIIKNDKDEIINGKNQKIAILTGGLFFYNYEKKYDPNFRTFINDINKNVKDLNKNIKIKINVSGLQDSYLNTNISLNAYKGEEGEGLLDLGMIISCCPALDEIHILPYTFMTENINGNVHMISNLSQQLEYCVNNKINVVSCSYGSAIKYYDNFDKDDDNFFKDYFDKLTICVSSGDDGGCNSNTSSYNTETKKLICNKNVPYPGSSKYVLSTGGTKYNLNNTEEITWYDSPGIKPYGGSSAGGISYFPKPSWQNIQYVNENPINNINKRLVPDVSGMAEAKWYLPLSLNKMKPGEISLVGGTSAVAPMYASFFIIVNQIREKNNLKPIGFVNDKLYELQSIHKNLFNDITRGKNTAGYNANTKYDMATGLGTPNFDKILDKLTDYNIKNNSFNNSLNNSLNNSKNNSQNNNSSVYQKTNGESNKKINNINKIIQIIMLITFAFLIILLFFI